MNYIDQQTEAVLFSLARSIEARDPYIKGHSERLARHVVLLGEALGLSVGQIQSLRAAAIVHDIGKVTVPDSILLKPGKLTPAERHVIRQHPVIGEEICAPLKSFRDVLPIVRHHHERMDGSGYPDGLKSEAIPLTVRIIQTVDIYDALTSERPYRRALSHRRALEQMGREVKRGWLDGEIVQKFKNQIASRSETT